MSRNRAALELAFTSAIWGFGFIATRWALFELTALSVTVLRFAGAAAALGLIIALSPKLRGTIDRQQLRYAFLPAFFLSGCLVLQTIGLRYTTATNSGFITTLYVLFVPPAAWLVNRHPIARGHFVLVLVALAGTALMCQLNKLALNVGDLWTLGCALFGAGHIVTLSYLGSRISNAFTFNFLQVGWSLAFVLPLALVLEPLPTLSLSPLTWAGLIFLALGSSVLAFSMQINAQRVLPASLSSLLCLLESPFAAFFAFFLLSESLTYWQWAGAALITIAAVVAVRRENQVELA